MNWNNGVEAWCDLPGTYVSFVRESTAFPELDEIIICAFGVISDTDCSNVNSFTTDQTSLSYKIGAQKLTTS